MRRLLPFLLLLSLPLCAQEDKGDLLDVEEQQEESESGKEDEEVKEEEAEAKDKPEADTPSPYVAAGWCTIQKKSPDESTADSSDNSDSKDSYCDMGVGFAFYRFKRWKNLFVVGVLGAKSAGPGIGYKVPTPENSPIIVAVAVGLLFRYDSIEGIGRDLRPGIGMTLSF